MSEYIERDAAIKAFHDKYGPLCSQDALFAMLGTLHDVPAADLVTRDYYDRLLAENDRLRKERPVVRCGECRLWDKDWIPNYSRDHEHFCPAIGIVTHADWFCADGERKGADGE